jgi:hypothetical protein
MTLTINVPQATLTRLQAEAKATGKDVDTFVTEAIEAKLARRQPTLAEVLKPIHGAVKASGLSEAELESLFEEELKAHRAERHSSPA